MSCPVTDASHRHDPGHLAGDRTRRRLPLGPCRQRQDEQRHREHEQPDAERELTGDIATFA
jgi:hypothetical protein